MTLFEGALWGLFGAFTVEGLDLYAAVRRHGRWPWQVRGPREIGALGYFLAELIRLSVGAGLATALTSSGQITSAVAALAVGVAAPLIIERLTKAIPLTDSVQDKDPHSSLKRSSMSDSFANRAVWVSPKY